LVNGVRFAIIYEDLSGMSRMPDDLAPSTVNDAETLRAILGEPSATVRNKEMPRLDAICRRFIELSPILFIGSSGADGKGDITPRGDPPGFVKVLDDKTLLIPERVGNKRGDTLNNVLANANVGLIFLIPGVDETLRVNGRASIVDDPAVLAPMALNGKTPKLAIRIDIIEAYIHCGRALKRAQMWNPASVIDRKSFPSMAEMAHAQRRRDTPVSELETYFAEFYATLY
jgi:PPOX class probable FMN-dependent enzyme